MNVPVPQTYLGRPVPEHIAAGWRTWDGAAWRQMAYRSTNRLNPPDQRFSVLPPGGMCVPHLEMRRGYRDMHFNPVSGDRWPGVPGSPFTIVGPDLSAAREWRRAEWDERASEQMRAIEEMCLSGRSSQCGEARTCEGCRLLACRCGQ
jgi:hypothetical protein